MLGAAGGVGGPQLAAHHPLPHAVEVGVGPLGGGPGARELDVGGQVHLLQLVVDKLTNVPWKIVVSEVVPSGYSYLVSSCPLSYPSMRGTSVRI